MQIMCLLYGVLIVPLFVFVSTSKGQDCYEAPVITSAEAINAEDIRLEWEINDPEPNCNSTLKHFDIVYYRSSIEQGSTRADADKRSRQFQVETPCTTQTCYIEANYEGGELARSEEVNVTLEDVPPIDDLLWQPIFSHTLFLTWLPVPFTCNILHYNVRYKLRERDQCQVIEGEYETRTSHNASLRITDLEPHSTYDVEVEAVGDVEPLWNKTVAKTSAQTGQAAPSKPPENLTFDNKTRDELIFIWEQPACGDRNGAITGYEYNLRKMPANETHIRDFTAVTNIRFEDLEDYTEYRFEISARTTAGIGVSTTIVARTEEGVPAAPSVVTAEVYLNTITLQWEKPLFVPGKIMAYYIYHKSDEVDHETYTRIAENEGGLTKFKLEGLMGRTKYILKIMAETGGGMGSWSPDIERTTAMTLAGVIVLSVILGSLILVVVAVLFMIVLRKKLTPEPIIIDINGQYNPYGVAGEVAWNKFSLGNKVGEGRFGKTYVAMLSIGDAEEKRQVVCKQLTLKPTANKDEVCQQFSRLHRVTKHAHVLHVVGFCLKRGNIYVLKEHANQGDLYTYLHRERPYGIPQDFKLRVSVAIAHGMQHLASHMVVHGDLCLHKILLNESSQEWVPKITGFGMADYWGDLQTSEVPSTSTSGDAGGSWPVHQCSPEKIERNIVDTKGDIWAFGVLLWEFFTESSAPGRLRTGRVEKCPASLDKRLYNIMKHCWLADPRKRPQFFDLADALTAFLMPDDIDEEEHPYDILKPQEKRSRSLRGSSAVSQPRVSISSAEVPRSSISGRRGTGAGDYYSQVPRDDDMDEVVLLQRGEIREDQEGVGNPAVVDTTTIYSSRMGSIIPGQHLVIAPIATIEEEDEDLRDDVTDAVETQI